VISPSAIQLPPLVSESWRPFDDRATARGLRVTQHSSAGLEVMTDPVLLRSILSNLFANAVEYTPPHGSIEIQVDAGAASYVVRVINDCSNLHADDVPMLFNRFWRHDSARSGGEHNGLGLSLARAFAQDLGGDLVARLDEDRLTMTLEGPLALDVRSRS
jgi:signal transduction histidine kinase